MRHFVGHVFSIQWVAIASLFFGFSFSLLAQDIPLGTWRTHFSYQNAKSLEATSEKIFCAFENGLVSYDREEKSIRKLSKIDGLSGVSAAVMAYHSPLDILLIGYESGFVDLIFRDRIVTIADLANSALEIDRQVNDAVFVGNNAYLATGLGIVVIDLVRAEVVENFVQIGSNGSRQEVFEIEARNDSLFVRTPEGIQSGSLQENLLDFGQWNRYEGTRNFSALYRLNHSLFALSAGQLQLFSSLNSWETITNVLPLGATKLFGDQATLFTYAGDSVYRWDATSTIFEPIFRTSAAVNDIVEDFIATDEFGFGTFQLNTGEFSMEARNPAGPMSDDYSRIKSIGNTIYGFHAPDAFGYDGTVQVQGYSRFENGNWDRVDITSFHNIDDVAAVDGNLFFGSIGDGLYDASAEEILTDIPGSQLALDTIVSAVGGRAGQLWISTFDNTDLVHRWDGEDWQSFSQSLLPSTEFLSIDISATGTAWLKSAFGSVVAINADDQEVQLLNSGAGIPGNSLDLVINQQDEAWVATTQGVALFESASFIFNSPSSSRPTFQNEELFGGNRVNTVATDGGDRVWFGTNEGLFAFDGDITEQVHSFTTTSSPIPSNIVLDLAYNTTNGELFISTDQGMVSFRTASSNARNVHREVTVFPNPVRPGYSGLVGIKGLARGVSVKVTDVNGNLVQELASNGGTASWDLQTLAGGRVATGVYFFFSSTADGQETFVGKIAVVR